MTGADIVHALQVLNGLAWLVPLWANTPSLIRLFRGRARGNDPFFAVAWFIAVAQIGFIARWLFWPQTLGAMTGLELNFWAVCYLVNGTAAIAAYAIRRRLERGR